MFHRFGVWCLIAVSVGLAAYPVTPPVQARGGFITPELVGFAATNGPLNTVHVMGGYAYVVSQNQSRLDVFTITDPTMPQLAGSYTATSAITDIEVTSTHLYVATNANGLRVLSLVDPAHPQEVGAFTQFPQVFSTSLGLGYLVIAVGGAGLRVLSLASPAMPAEIGAIDWQDSSPSTTWLTYGVVIEGRFAYVSASNLRSSIYRDVFVVDLALPTNPMAVEQSELRIDVETLHAVWGSYGYLTSMVEGLTVVDLRDPTAITVTGLLDTTAIRSTNAIAPFGYYGYMATADGVKVVDVSNPAAPTEVGSALAGTGANGLVVDGTYLYVAGQDGLYILTHGLQLDQKVYLPRIHFP